MKQKVTIATVCLAKTPLITALGAYTVIQKQHSDIFLQAW